MKILLLNLESFKLSGVYVIKNLINNKIYIGSTKMSFKRRYLEHVRLLKIKKHHNFYLSNAVNKYGIENFEFSIIEIINNISIPYLRQRESYYIDILNSITCGYNLSNRTISPPYNLESNKKISNTLKEKYKTDSVFRENQLYLNSKKRGIPSWNKGLKCDNISNARKELFDDIEVYDINMNFFRRFDNPIEVEKFSRTKENDLPVPEYIEFENNNSKNKLSRKYLKNKIISSQNIHRAIRNNKAYKGLYFKKVKRNT